MSIITGVDLLGIQRYVFASNRLRDVLAASWMVDHVVSKETLIQQGIPENHILLASGGNATIEFADLSEARNWTAHYTRWLQDTAPSLEVVIVHRRYDHQLAGALKALAIDLARTKLERRPSTPQLGLSVTASCAMTGLPATTIDQGELVSTQIAQLRHYSQQAKSRWQKFLPDHLIHAPGWSADFPDDLDLMGRTHGETSLVGVVHIDGNSVGKSIQQWLDRCLKNDVGDKQVRIEYRAWSGALANLVTHTLQTVVSRVSASIFSEQEQCFVRGTPYQLGFPLQEDKGSNSKQRVLLPIRPILLGGDDLTFVCDARIALDLAAIAVEAFGAQAIPHLGEDGDDKRITACAGIALVKGHAPFHRSYELSESLCDSAKRARNTNNEEHQIESGCWLDWHVGSMRPSDTVKDLRNRQYDGHLTMRPYPLTRFENREQTWDWLDTKLLGPGRLPETAEQGFRGDQAWITSRNRVKRLSALVHEGSDSIKCQMEAWKAIEKKLRLPAGLSNQGFIDKRTPLLDAIELLDIHIRLDSDPIMAMSSIQYRITRG